jgi:hypothetical protein
MTTNSHWWGDRQLCLTGQLRAYLTSRDKQTAPERHYWLCCMWLKYLMLVTIRAVVGESTGKAKNASLYSYGPSLFIYTLCPDNSSSNKSWPKNSHQAFTHTLTDTKPTSLRQCIMSFDTNHSLTWMNKWASNRPVHSCTTKARTYNKRSHILPLSP